MTGIHEWLRRFFPRYSARAAYQGSSRDADIAGSPRLLGSAIHRALGGATTAARPQSAVERAAALRGLKALQRRGLVIVRPEAPVRDPLLGFATRVDLLVRPEGRTGPITAVEVKWTNNEDGFDTPCGRVAAPLCDVIRNDSAAQQAVAQALIPTLAQRARGKDIRAAVLVITPRSARWIPAPLLDPRDAAALRAALAPKYPRRRRAVRK